MTRPLAAVSTSKLHRTRSSFVGLCVVLSFAGPLHAQHTEGTTGGAIAGAMLGAYSGSMLTLAGSLVPCGQTMAGPSCSAWVAGVGGIIAAAGGAALGSGDDEAFVSRVEAGMIGAVAGGVAGYALKGIVRQYGWLDVVSGAALGLAIGSSARGSAIGLGAGALAGGVLLATVPSIRVTDAVAVSLAGLAIGGVVGWVGDGVEAQRDQNAPVVLSFSFTR